MLIFLGYILEIGICYVWYKLILKNELVTNNIVSRSIQNIMLHRKSLLLYLTGRGTISVDQTKALDNIKRCLLTLFIEMHYLVAYILLGPVFLSGIITTGKNGIIKSVIYLGMLGALVIKELKEDTQKIAEIINSYIRGVMLPIEHKPDLLQVKEKENSVIKWDYKNILIVLVGIITVFFVIFISNCFKDNVVFKTVVFLLAVLMMIKDSYRQSKKTKRPISVGIKVDSYLENIQTEIENMCVKLGIRNLECRIISSITRRVESKINENGVPQIEISNGFINSIYSKDAKDILLLTIGHELGHIYYNDFKNVKRRLKIAATIELICYTLSAYLLILSISKPLLLLGSVPLFMVITVFGKIMSDKRYWAQIAELRADRLAVQICESDKMSFIEFWKNDMKNNPEKEINVVCQFYRRYVKVVDHPSMERRMELLEKRDKWYWWEYFEHVFTILRWRVTNKGWNGE